MKHTYYALHRKGFGLMFSCHASTLEGHKEKVQGAFQKWKWTQPKGTKLSVKDYMQNQTEVKITVEELS